MSRCTSSSPILLSARCYFSNFYIHHPRSLASRMVPVGNFDQTSHSRASLTNARCPQSYVACGHCTCECGNNLRTHLPILISPSSLASPPPPASPYLPLRRSIRNRSTPSPTFFFAFTCTTNRTLTLAPTGSRRRCARVCESGRMEETRKREVDGRWAGIQAARYGPAVSLS
jgi:hypothetical protein